eukprot:GFYU01008335.1.p1 GENE.GFYU01008335.1~~GFYU01008335.1.p1  ORF type:complete len:554 (+),score=89.93 GFYU01008335.1:100-1761(+)
MDPVDTTDEPIINEETPIAQFADIEGLTHNEITQRVLNSEHPVSNEEKKEPSLLKRATSREVIDLGHTVDSTGDGDVGGGVTQGETVGDGDRTAVAKKCIGIANRCHQRGQYDLALDYQQRALAALEEDIGRDHPAYARQLRRVASSLKALNRDDEAMKTYESALEIVRRVPLESSLDLANTLNDLGSIQTKKEEYALALRSYEEAADIVKEHLGPNHSGFATCMYTIGVVYYNQTEYDTALGYYEQGLAIDKLEANFGSRHVNVATSLMNIGNVLMKVDRYSDALLRFQEALDILQQLDSPLLQDLTTASTLLHMATCYVSSNDLDAALDSCQKAARIVHPGRKTQLELWSTCMNQLASIYETMDRLPEAIEAHKEAAKADATRLGSKHLHVIKRMSSIGELCIETGDHDRAAGLLEASAEGMEGHLGDSHPQSLRTRRSLLHVTKMMEERQTEFGPLQRKSSLTRWLSSKTPTISRTRSADTLTIPPTRTLQKAEFSGGVNLNHPASIPERDVQQSSSGASKSGTRTLTRTMSSPDMGSDGHVKSTSCVIL